MVRPGIFFFYISGQICHVSTQAGCIKICPRHKMPFPVYTDNTRNPAVSCSSLFFLFHKVSVLEQLIDDLRHSAPAQPGNIGDLPPGQPSVMLYYTKHAGTINITHILQSDISFQILTSISFFSHLLSIMSRCDITVKPFCFLYCPCCALHGMIFPAGTGLCMENALSTRN